MDRPSIPPGSARMRISRMKALQDVARQQHGRHLPNEIIGNISSFDPTTPEMVANNLAQIIYDRVASKVFVKALKHFEGKHEAALGFTLFESPDLNNIKRDLIKNTPITKIEKDLEEELYDEDSFDHFINEEWPLIENYV